MYISYYLFFIYIQTSTGLGMKDYGSYRYKNYIDLGILRLPHDLEVNNTKFNMDIEI